MRGHVLHRKGGDRPPVGWGWSPPEEQGQINSHIATESVSHVGIAPYRNGGQLERTFRIALRN